METTSCAKHVLKKLGFSVTKISEGQKEEADFLAAIDGYVALIEEKTKLDDRKVLDERMEQLDEGQLYTSHIPLVRNNILSGIVRKAASQLRSSSDKAHNFRLIWFTGAGINAEAQYHQFIATVYGTTNIVEMNSNVSRRCYFYRNSDFHRYSEIIDGAIAAYMTGKTVNAKLCLNPLSPNYQTLRASAVSAAFGTAVEDPKTAESNGTAFIVDGDFDRKNERVLLEFLQAKYSTKPLMGIDTGYVSAVVSIKRNDRLIMQHVQRES